MVATTLSHDVPYDIIFSILSKSTVKSLVRFTGVSKSINAFIRSSTFIATYHRNQIHNNYIIESYDVQMPNGDREDQEPCFLSREDQKPSLLRCEPVPPSHKYNLVFPFRMYHPVGACEGLICFTKDSNVYIWNPFIGSVKIVPPSGSINSNNEVAYRFEFSKRSCDYKVIKQIYSIVDPALIILEIYSLTRDSWRKIEHRRLDWFVDTRLQLLYKRFIYWMGGLVHPQFLKAYLRFDLDEEIFEEVPMSEFSLDRFELSFPFRDAWNRDEDDVLIYHVSRHRCLCSRRSDHYLVPVKESLMLFDQKDVNGY